MDVGRSVRRRAGAVIVSIGILYALLSFRLFDLQVLGHDRLGSLRVRQSSSRLRIDHPRGSILDARGELLAVSLPVASVYADPRRVPGGSTEAVARALSMEPARVKALLSRTGSFVWLKRSVTPEEEGRIRALNLPRVVDVRREFERLYPAGEDAAHVLGLVRKDPADALDAMGGEGIELRMDARLRREDWLEPVQVDARRRPLTGVSRLEPGADVQLTLDARVAGVVEEELDAVVTEWSPKWASVVVLDPRDGTVLAMSNRPGFDPNRGGEAPAEHRRNRAVTDFYEPGSIVKLFSIAGALDERLLTPETTFPCNGTWRHGPRTMHEHDDKVHGTIRVTEIVSESCNLGAAMIGAKTLGERRLHDWFAKFGFGRRTGVELPAETPGQFKSLAKWDRYYTVTSMSIGHEISVTPLQLANATAVLANGGVWRPVRLVECVTAADGRVLDHRTFDPGRRILSPKTCAQVRSMMVACVEQGTGRECAVEGVTVAGKTGTTQKFDPSTRSYRSGKHTGSFVCFAPAGEEETARVVVVVVIDEPQGAYYGGKVAAPAARRILERILPIVR